MKKLFLLLFLPFLIASCGKKLTNFPLEESPFLVYPKELRQNILIENFCAEWSEENVETSQFLDSFYTNSSYRVIPVKFHEGDWLETSATQYLKSFLGGAIQIPTGSINRIPAKGTTNGEDGSILMKRQNWSYNASLALNQNPIISMAMNTILLENSLANIEVYIAQRDIMSDEVRLVLYFVEDNIIPLNQLGMVTGFKHNHVYKETYPNETGIIVDLSNEKNNQKVQKVEFKNVNLSLLNLDRLRIVAFAYTPSNDFKERTILNAQTCGIGGSKTWQ